jgi:membrane-associated phospholipid phosphatase
VGYSRIRIRIRIRAHWPTDVAFGVLLGVLVGEAAHRLLKPRGM